MNFNEMNMLNFSICIYSALVTLILLIGSTMDKHHSGLFMRHFIILLITNFFMQIGEAGIWFFNGDPEHTALLYISIIVSMEFSYTLIVSYYFCMMEFFKEKRKSSITLAYIIMGICGVYMLMTILSAFNGMFFSVDENGYLVYGKFYGLVRIFDFAVILIGMFIVFGYRKVITLKKMLSLMSFSILPLISMLIQFIWYPAPEYAATTLSLIIIYTLFHGEIMSQLAQQKILLAQKETQLAENRILVMLSQIQPHFMYNTLTTIMYLCRTDPEEAERTLGQFSHYIRANMDSLTLKQCIPFDAEMNHVKTYLSLESKRFAGKLNIDFDIKETDLLLPALTVQPLVENAIKHGMKQKKILKIRISSYSDNKNYYIEINDNGKGFDVNQKKNDGKSHIGIENVRNRLQMMCGGKLTITSVPDAGTVAVIEIPK